MKPLSRHRINFTWARNEYNKTDDPEQQNKYAALMSKYLAEGTSDGFTIEEITRGGSYPLDVEKIDPQIASDTKSPANDEEIKKQVQQAVDVTNVIRIGSGGAAVYAYGYSCLPDRLKIGYATGDVVQRIADQIFTSTPDKPVLYLVIKTDAYRALERSIHAVLELRGRKISCGGTEWFKATREEIIEIYKLAIGS